MQLCESYSFDKSFLPQDALEIAKEVKMSDGLWRFVCGNVSFNKFFTDHPK